MRALLRPFLVRVMTALGLMIALSQPSGAQDWPAFGNDPGGSQYSPLTGLSPANVAGLRLAWVHHSGDVAGEGSPTGPTALEAVPIVVNKLLYTCTPFGRVFALDPASGKEAWVFDPYAARDGGKALMDGPRKSSNCRGVAYWQAAAPEAGKPCEKRIFKPDGVGHVFAIDADTGKSCADFGAAKGHAGFIDEHDYDNHGDGALGMGSPPAIIGDVVVATVSANDGYQHANHGMVRGFDVRTGDVKWAFDPIPPEHANETGAGNVWSTMSADPARGLVFLPTTSPSSDYYGGGRKFEMPLTQATVALDGATGAVKWSYQIVHHDTFDYDLVGHPLLVTIHKDGRDIPVAIQQTKMGFLYVFDRDTGAPVFPIKETPTCRGSNPRPPSPCRSGSRLSRIRY